MSERVFHYQKITTGFFEDVQLFTLRFLDEMALCLKYCARFRFSSSLRLFRKACARLSPANLLSDEGIDKRSVGEIINDSGYEYERHITVTDDGHLLTIDRIPRRNSPHIVYFQHGLIDSSFAWVANGTASSLGFRVFDLGYDVFMGNFRGCTGEGAEHTNPDISPKEYWGYSLNEHAFFDVKAIVHKILEIKRMEFEKQGQNGDASSFKITVIAHSMGAGCILAYVIHCGLHKRPHHLSKLVLMSPAGFHAALPPSAVMLPLLARANLLGIHCYRFPSWWIRVLAVKVVHDINNNPTSRLLLAWTLAQLLLGGETKNIPFQYVHNMMYHLFGGTSVKVFSHFLQLWKSGEFLAYDYGKRRNQIEYGSPTPLDFGEHYDQVNVPVHIVMGEMDRVIPPSQVMRHIKLLHDVNPDLVKVRVFRRAGHIDMTFGVSKNEGISQHILSLLTPSSNTSDAGDEQQGESA